MSRSGLRQLMTTQQMKIQASHLAKYEQVGTLAYSYNLELCLSHIYDVGVKTINNFAPISIAP